MKPSRPKHHRPQFFRRRGFTLPEALIALAICATLLSAMGTAFTATARSLTANNDFSSATQLARSAMVRMERDIRAGIPAANGRAGNIATGISLVTNGVSSTYTYDATNKKLTYTSAGTTKTLANNISACKFTVKDGTDSASQSCISQVGITLTATVGKNTVTLSGSATPRRNLPTTPS